MLIRKAEYEKLVKKSIEAEVMSENLKKEVLQLTARKKELEEQNAALEKRVNGFIREWDNWASFNGKPQGGEGYADGD